MLPKQTLPQMVVGRGLALLPHQPGMKPIHGIAFAPLDAVAVRSVGHDLARPAQPATVYLGVDNLAPAGAAKVIHLRDLLQILLREELGQVAHEAVGRAFAFLY